VSESGESQDKVLTCADCRDEFTWSVGEQAFFKEKGLTNEPKHCKDCRRANKRHRGAREARKGDNL
jgi:hypothetical protein